MKLGKGRHCAECGFSSNAASPQVRAKSLKNHCKRFGHHEAR